MNAKLPEWVIRLDGDVLGVLYVDYISPTEKRAIAGLLAMHQDAHDSRITIEQVESKLLKEMQDVAEPANTEVSDSPTTMVERTETPRTAEDVERTA